MENGTSHPLDGKEKQTAIGQMEWLLIDTVIEKSEITVVLSIIKWTQLHRHCMLARGDETGELEERS
jgi:hypothetical protein